MSRYSSTCSISCLVLVTWLAMSTLQLRAEDKTPKGPDKRNGKFQEYDFTKDRESLRYADFRDSNCYRAKFNRLKLIGVDFRDVNLEYVRFDECDLTGADFRDSHLTGAAFRLAKMEGVNMEECDNFDASNVETLRKAKLKKVRIKGSLENTDLREADLRGADMSGIHFFPGAKFKKAIYSDETIFMDGFDPVKQGMIKKDLDDDLTDENESKKSDRK